jgi:acyl transferase domain-containing protein/enoyl-CoA hydratase/carnithine racemase/acyl carrier protein/NAD(P)-dependent dehydrogenase (short-subunit alcohol dehydrogenase family)/SAM-dependent methyltransferase
MTRATLKEPIAIIGVGLRLPGADSLDAFWAHLAAGRSLITEVSPRRWDAKELRGNPSKENKTNSIWGGFLDDADAFDAAFFNISPREASWMDPQQRFALEMAWHAIEDAGLRASALAGSDTGVYMGVCHWDYAELIEKHLTTLDAYTPTGIAFSVIANRVSHFFDFKGPSVTNDTACAASLVSIYEAVRALQNGECGLALAGGVNLAWSPNHFIAFAKSGMLSKDGKAKAFDARADGYVRGEGGAMVLLKPLPRAEADGDPIHAVIRGIATNHGGRTSSLTVTNPNAQAELIAQVHRDAGVSPDTVSYIEAHGPGTPLGDPIEIAGLKAAFRARAAETGAEPATQSCGVGSVKTNIGHLEGAAGVAGVVKVLAALRHEALPPNVGFETLNPLIDLAGTPFRIQSTTTPWPREGGKPRRAGVSSFGFGGTNAHVVLEDAAPRADAERLFNAPLVLPLSARTDESLRAYARNLRDFLDRNPAVALADLALTFQTGREAMRCRAAFVAEDIAELRDALSAFIERAPDSRVRLPGADAAEAEPWRSADQWAGGADVSFTAPRDARRISAPLHPFQREPHWIDTSLGAKDAQGVPHPFLHRNLSTFDGVAYRSRFTGTEYFLAHHHVQGRKILPGVVALEMARAAYANAGGFEGAMRLSDVVWSRAIAAGESAVDVGIRLTRASDERVDFAVSALDNGTDGPVCVQGSAQRASPLSAVQDLAALTARTVEIVSPDVCYARLAASGVVHGPALQAMVGVRRGDGFVLADLRLQRRLAASLSELPLHPVLLDAAIQAWVALSDDAPSGAGVPFACREIVVTGPCEAAMVAYVRPTPGARTASGILRLDIDLCDRSGRACVAFKELTLRLVAERSGLASAGSTAASLPENSNALVLAQGAWEEAPSSGGAAKSPREVTVFLAGAFARLEKELAARTGLAVRTLPDADADDDARTAGQWQRTLTVHLAEVMAARPTAHQKFLVLAPSSVPAFIAAPLAGLLRTVGLEQPKMSGVVVHVEGDCGIDQLARIVAVEAASSDTFVELRHEGDGRRLAWRPVEIAAPAQAEILPIDPDGVYWITGGLGGLGLIFAKALAARGARRIVLSARSDVPGATRQALLDALRAEGADIHILACDVADRGAVDRLVATVERTLGPLKGIVHAAGVLDDAYIFGGDPARIDPVLAPKIAGTLNIDAATAHLDLSFVMLCSSVASVFGNAGQAAYAGANAFMDAFAEHRAKLVAAGARQGLTRAIAWPLWAEGGMGVAAPFLEALRHRFGAEPMPTPAGIDAFWRLLSQPISPRAVVLHGDRAHIDSLLSGVGEPAQRPEASQTEASSETTVDSADLLARTTDYLKELLADATQIEVARIRAGAPLIEYGLDSIVIVDVTARLERVLGPLSKTLFFEHVTLASLAQHLVDEHAAALLGGLPGGQPATSAAAAVVTVAREAVLQQPIPLPAATAPAADDTHDVAIIGLSLRVAKAATQDAFWEMLSKGLHSVGPVPEARWNHKAIYHPERDVLGKSVVKTGAFLDDIDKFDPRYFRISQAEAELMSPEVRLFLEASVEAFEDAGYSRETMQAKLGGDVAVLVGSMTNEYDYFGFQNMLVRGAQASGSYTGTVPNMVSYFYGFTGPSYFLDTMCSAASTCIHEAVHMLRSGRCKMALAGGVSLLLHPQKLIAVSQEHFTSKTADVVRGYGLGADGTILGEGVGALVLKRRVDAERDGDHIYGVIKGTAVTNAGVRNGFTVPSPAQQAAAISKAIDDADIDPRTISYVEGHGSGTALGDPIEIRGLTQAYRAHTPDTQFCAIGTVKSNVAHLLAAAGLAGVAKVLMQMKHGQLAPSLHAETLNPDIPFATTPFYVQRELAAWPRTRDAAGREVPRRAGVTSIGAGGMNSHILIEEHIGAPRAAHPGGAEVAVFSAMNPAALTRLVTRMRDHIAANAELPLADIAYTLQVGRTALPCRLAAVAASRADLVSKLSAFVAAPGTRDSVWFTPSTLERDPRVKATSLADATAARTLDRVAAWWADGVTIDWDALHAGRRPYRVSLPAYPFEKVRCWYPEFPDALSVLDPLASRDGAIVTKAAPLVAPAEAVAGEGGTSDAALVREVTALAAGLLKFDAAQISPRASFYDLGFDSISLTRFAALIGERLGVTVSPAIFFECEHIDALCRHLASRGALVAGAAAAPRQSAVQAATAPAIHAAPVGTDSGRMKVAIVGVALRLPGANDPDTFIDRLLAGEDLTSAFPFSRYDADYADRLKAASFAKRGGFIADVDRFDAAFFRISPIEAERMDPQQRLMLETAWRALESAGYRPEELPKDTGVFVGVSGRDYASLLEAHSVAHDGFAATGNSLAMVANRISYQLDVHGPSEAIDTACSSSLVALVRAAEALAAGTCSMALVGGVNLALALEGFEGPHLAGMLSPEGRCKTFSADADGYGRGEGVVALLLKPLARAEADRDTIFGVLIGGAVNHGGRAGALTAPNARAQADLIVRAMAGIDAASIGYIETHGTGTVLGDPVEIAALRLAYDRLAGAGRSLPRIGLGAVKSNIGHLEAAAGLAGVVKVLGAMRRGEVPPTLHCRDLNPHIELDGSPLVIQRERAPWIRRQDDAGSLLPRRAGVSSFGFGGVNAHVVLEEHPGSVGGRARLPARRFAETRFWIPGHPGAGTPSPSDETVLLAPRWTEAALPASSTAVAYRRLVLTCGVPAAAGGSTRIVDCDVGVGDIGARYLAAAGAALDAIQTELRREATPTLVQLVHPLDGDGALFAGLGALLDTAMAEAPLIIGQVIGFPGGLAPAVVSARLDREAQHPQYRRVRHEGGRRLVRTWVPLSEPRLQPPALRDGGVHLITGGLGGLGRLIARDIAARSKAPALILVGRSPLDAEGSRHLSALQEAGARATYHAIDITDAAAVAALVDDAVRAHGALDGVFHCAGVLRDRMLLNKPQSDLAPVLAPKVQGALALAAACKGRDVDAFVLFSSLAGAVGNAGQGDYAAANGFLDAFAAARFGDLPVVSLNWPLWRDGGMRLDAAGQAALFDQMGQRPLTTDAGLAALGAAQQAGRRQIAVVSGDGARIRDFFAAAGTNRVAAPATPSIHVSAPVPQRLVERTSEALRHLFSRVSGVAANRIETDTPLDEYGIDSLMITRLNRELGDVFGTLSSSLMFEHRTLGALARHLAARHPDGCRRLTGEDMASEDRAPLASATTPVASAFGERATAPQNHEPIAIIGISGRYPGAEDLDAFWRNLAEGRDLVGEVPRGRWPLDGFFEADVEAAVAQGASYGKWGAFLEDFAGFDPLFFRIAPRDAAAMDPQERLFLMAAWAACEDAGYSPARLKARHDARVGVFAGVTKTGFALHGAFVSESGATVRPTTSFAGIANRVSHVLDLNGPSLPIDTMCSSSLTAIHEAAAALRAGTCDMALAGGVNLYLHPSNFFELSAARMLSPDGRCKSFGDGANGFVPGEGVGCLLLKPLSRALADGDTIHALIRGTAVNHGGRTNGYTVPNPLAQRDVIRAALDDAGLEARAVTCIEAHGTGTDLGDPIEVAALTQAFETATSESGFCALGSVKSNIGHLEAAAGIAGVTKVVLQMKHGQLAPTLHAGTPNPKLGLAATPFRLQTELAPWDGPRIAGVSSFGAGGANAHVIVEDWPSASFPLASDVAEASERQAFPVVLSARDTERLRACARRLLAAVEHTRSSGDPLRLEDIAFTLQVGREAMEERLALEVTTLDGLAAGLSAYLDGKSNHPGLYTGNVRDHRAVMAALAGDDEDTRALVRSWAARGCFGRLLALWVQGLPVDWEASPRDGQPRIVSLPTYPFARDRYWIPQKARNETAAPAVAARAELPGDDSAALLAGVEALDAAITPLVTALVAALPRDDLPSPFGRWRDALAALVPAGHAIPVDAAWAAWARFKEGADPRLASQIALAETTLRALPDILSGRCTAPSVMFPAGRLDLVEAVYKDNAVAVRFSAALASAAAERVKARLAAKPGAPIRVLEIGAGTGGTSEPVFAALAPFGDSIAEYRYTDVSRAFLIKAEQRFAARVPSLATALFDAEKPPTEQGIATGLYDIVIAANVLHATADIRRTLRHVRQTLAPGGVLLLNETSRATLFTHVTFGLLDGWWRFTDAELRIPGTPSLNADSWRTALEAEGYTWGSASGPNERRLGQQIIIAETPMAVATASSMIYRGAGLRETLRRAVGETLNMPPASVGLDKPFADYGLDSILGAELVERIRGALGIKIEQTRLYDFGNVLRLESHIAQTFPEAATVQTRTDADVPAAPLSAPALHQSSSKSAARGAREPIAIIGISGRFAQSPDAETLWAHLNAGRNLVAPATRFSHASGRHGSFIESFDRFDPVFFGISGLEATYMDPQQRLFLEEAWKALEHAGHAGTAIEGRRCGVFVGCSAGDYQELFRSQPPGQAFWGNTSSLIPARIAYCLDLKGPAIAVDTACSSSLVALDLACRSLWSGESELALTGGVFVQCTDRFFRYADAARMLSPSGRCAAFGDAADGIVPGEAVAAVVLRPLSAALADGDTIHGLIVGSGTNQDGATNGITAPSGVSQQRLMREVYEAFGIDPAGIGFVEAHGTGTPLGDPIEYDALAAVFSEAGAPRGACLLGSVKSNLGHATTAAGITSLIKVLGALKAGIVPPTLHIGTGNPAIHTAEGPFRINKQPEAWPTKRGAKRAVISSFGFSGTNAHVVVEEAPPVAVARDAAPSHLVVLSARTPEQLRQQAERLVAHLRQKDGLTLRDVAFTLLAGRRPLAHRLACVAVSLDDLASRLSRWLAGTPESGVRVATVDTGAGRHTKAGVDRADPTAIADAFLAGEALDAEALFAGSGRRRVPLPVYPFAPTRYWVEDAVAAPAIAAPVVTASAVAASVAIASSPSRRVLAPVATVMTAAAPRPVGKIKLASLQAVPVVAAATPIHIAREIEGDGICRLTPSDVWSGALEAALVDELRAVSVLADVRVVLLSVPASWGAEPVASRVSCFTDAVLACAVPVIAAVKASCRGSGLCAALACDFAVFAAEARFAAQGAEVSNSLLQRRVGAELATSLLSIGQERTGAELREAGLALPVSPADRVDETALALATAIARAPRLALSELKTHMRRAPLHPGGSVPAREALRPFAIGGGAGPHGAPRRVALSSPAVTLETFSDGAALIRMEERDGRNTFTPRLMDGLSEAFALVARSADLKAVVLTGFEGYFACGGTSDGLESLQRGETHFTDRRIYSLPLECPLPVIAAMQGHAIGAGWALGMFCDLALFGAESVYHSNYLELGFTPGAGATLIFPRRLGDDLGREVLFSAVPFKGRDLKARAQGLHVMPAASVLTAAMTLAHALAETSRDALVAAKLEGVSALREALPGVLERELDMHRRTFIGNADVLARIRAAFPAAPSAPAATAPPTTSGRLAEVSRAVVESLAEELMIGAADIRDGSGFLDLGLDSILAVTWIRRLNARFGIELPATAVYAQPTVGAFVARVAELLPTVSEGPAPAKVSAVPTAAHVETPAAPVTNDYRARVRERVVASLAEELMIDASDIRDGAGFLDLGLDSILAVTWIRRLNAAFGTELPATAVYGHPTVGALVDKLAGEAQARAPIPECSPEPKPAAIASIGVQAEPSLVPKPDTVTPALPRAAPERTAIAIIGMSGRFPKAPDLRAFWDNIRTERDCITDVPAERWSIAAHYDSDPQAPGKSYCKWMGAIDGVDRFDPGFFNITPREAELMDPQQRLFLAHAWHAIEDAGLDPTSLAGTACGVFVGSGPSGYADLIRERNAYSLLGAAGSILAARIAYLLDLTGPAVSLDTACSSSLVSIAEACNSLVLGDSDLALAGGACVLIGPSMFVDTSKVSMLSKDGRCFTFDARANGFVPGEGVGVMLLKRLDDAMRDGDPIRAVIRGWGVNQDGKTNGIAAPNPQAQARLMRGIHDRFAIAPDSIGLIECHGTGTALGDPIEVEGLAGAFEGRGVRAASCAIGSVKSNIGHLLASAGVAGAIKAVLALEHAELPPTIHVQQPNPHVAIAGTPFFVNTQAQAWPEPRHGRRRAAVSAFGFSGTNAHIVLEAAPSTQRLASAGPWVLPLSARTADRLSAYASDLKRFVADAPDLDLGALAATFQQGRTGFAVRRAIVFRGRDELLRALDALAADATAAPPFGSGDLDALAARWSAGERITWPETGAPRIQAPGYPFAEERCWVANDAPPEKAAAPFALDVRSDGGISARLVPDGVAAALIKDGLGELLLPLIACEAGLRATGRPVVGLKHMIWGRPQGGRSVSSWDVTIRSDAEGLIYDVSDPRDGWRPRHVGTLMIDTAEAERSAWPAPVNEAALRGEGARDVTALWVRFSTASACPTASDVVAVHRTGGDLIARLQSAQTRTEAGLLHLIWRLIAFSELNGHAPPPKVPFAMERFVVAGALSQELIVRITNEGSAVTVAAHTASGARAVLIDRLIAREGADMIEIDVQEEMLQ